MSLDNKSQAEGSPSNRGRTVRRRRLVKAVGATGLAGLAGCTGGGGSGGAEEETVDQEVGSEEITVKWHTTIETIPDNVDVLRQALYDGGLPENIKVDVSSTLGSTDNARAQYQQWLSAGRAEPDIMTVDFGWAIPLMLRGHLLNLSKNLDSSIIDSAQENYVPAHLDTMSTDGNIYALPMFLDVPTVHYRKDLVEEAGYDPEGENWATSPMTWKRFSEVISDTQSQTGVSNGYTFQADVYEGLACCDFNEFITSWGGAYFGSHENLFGPVGDRPVTLDSQSVIDSVKMVRAFIHGQDDEHALEGYKQISPIDVVGWSEEPSRAPFTAGEAVANRNWTYAISLNNEEFGDDLGLMPLPYAVEKEDAEYEGAGGSIGSLGGWHFAVNAYSEKKAAALEVLKAMTSDEYLLKQFEVAGLFPPKPALFSSDTITETEDVGQYADTLQWAAKTLVPRPATPVWPDQSAKISNEVNSAYRQEKTPEQAMSDLQEAVQAIEDSV